MPRLTIIVAALVAFVGAALALVWVTAPAEARSGAARAVWEYHCTLPPGVVPQSTSRDSKGEHHSESGHTAVKVLNHLGQQGWELVAIDPGNGHYCFKRPKR